VVRAIQALGFAGLRELKQTMERWFGPSITSEKDAVNGECALQRCQFEH
jgi:DNA-binding MurR/RpiR family transcriptional regulator